MDAVIPGQLFRFATVYDWQVMAKGIWLHMHIFSLTKPVQTLPQGSGIDADAVQMPGALAVCPDRAAQAYIHVLLFSMSINCITSQWRTQAANLRLRAVDI